MIGWMQYGVYVGSGLVGMGVGAGFTYVMTKYVRKLTGPIDKVKVAAGITLGAVLGYLAGSYGGWYVYEMFR